MRPRDPCITATGSSRTATILLGAIPPSSPILHPFCDHFRVTSLVFLVNAHNILQKAHPRIFSFDVSRHKRRSHCNLVTGEPRSGSGSGTGHQGEDTGLIGCRTARARFWSECCTTAPHLALSRASALSGAFNTKTYRYALQLCKV